MVLIGRAKYKLARALLRASTVATLSCAPALALAQVSPQPSDDDLARSIVEKAESRSAAKYGLRARLMRLSRSTQALM